MEFSKSDIITWGKRLVPVLLGAAGGYAYYHFVGCVSGTCPITSNAWSGTAYGALIGSFLISWSEPRRENDSKERSK
ncbi:MAG: hypothetical protein HYW57_03885 [Ignavibacteriales bacterium]|nr:hypothetical protein [Ignavibacteriales bacterium]